MELFELVIALLMVGALLTVGSTRIGLPYPVLLAFAGAAAAYLPGTAAISFDPHLALALFVAPVLLDAAFDASPRDLRDNWLTIGLLAVVVVGLTVAAVALVVHALVPGISWATAVTLGAVVAPPDASAATAVLRRLRPPHRILVILEGESLLNDASALLIYRIAVGLALGRLDAGWAETPGLLLALLGGGVLGWLLAILMRRVPTHRAEMPIAVLVQFLSTFAIWILADRLGASPIITLVVYAITIAQHGTARTDARRRIASYAVWEVAVLVLNMLAFILIGLQLKVIHQRLDGELGTYIVVASAVLGVAIAVRLVWVMGWNAIMRARFSRVVDKSRRFWQVRPTVGGGVLIAWCGMRGIVTLATALALPEAFPHRDLIVFCAFWVTLGTLALQGLTLRPLMRRLTLPEDTTVENEVLLARARSATAAIDMLRGEQTRLGTASRVLLEEYEARASRGGAIHQGDSLASLQTRAVAVQRTMLTSLRRDGTIGDDAYHTIEAELDVIALTADPSIRVIGVPDEAPAETHERND